VQDFRDLKVWAKAHALTLAVYQATEDFPKEERYGLTRQMRRATASIPANIAEGCVRSSDADSTSELEYLILLGRDLQLIPTAIHDNLTADLHEVKRMLIALIGRLKADS
jgi:four helix bundle protein